MCTGNRVVERIRMNGKPNKINMIEEHDDDSGGSGGVVEVGRKRGKMILIIVMICPVNRTVSIEKWNIS